MSDSKDIGTSPTLAADSLAVGAGPHQPSIEHVRLAERYELLGLLGVGGMGAVYRARDMELDEIVALKMLRADLVADPSMLARFRAEVRLARRVTHPNVARTFDIGEHGGSKFLTMELVDGSTLASTLAQRGALPMTEAVDIGCAICAGLAAAHAAGVVHRDLKPENVLIAKDGRVVVTDFGIAAQQAGTHGTRSIIGTPAYMAPEQLDSDATIDTRADLYSFGAVLFEMLAGERAWPGDALLPLLSNRARGGSPTSAARDAICRSRSWRSSRVASLRAPTIDSPRRRILPRSCDARRSREPPRSRLTLRPFSRRRTQRSRSWRFGIWDHQRMRIWPMD